MIKALIVLAALSSPAGAATPPPEPCTLKLKQLLEPLSISHEKLVASSPRVLRFRLRLTPKAPGLQPHHLWLSVPDASGGGSTTYPANRVGAFDIDMRKFPQGEETELQLGPLCKGGFKLGMELAVAGERTAAIDRPTIRQAMADYKEMIRHQGTLVRMFAPKLQTLVVRFPPKGGSQCTGTHKKGQDHFRPNAQNELGVSLSRFLEYDAFTCKAAPEEILLSADK